MALLKLPNELLLQIASYLDPPPHALPPHALKPTLHITSLLRTNRRLSTLLTPLLHSYALHSPHTCRTALFWSVALRNAPFVRLLLTSGTSMEIRDLSGTLLHRAPSPCTDTTLARIIQCGPNLNVEREDGRSAALSWSIGTGHTALCQLLLEKGADVTFDLDGSGSKALHIAAYRGNVAAVKLLLKHGAPVNDRWGVHGRSPLHMAVVKHQDAKVAYRMATVLLDHGADVGMRDQGGNTPLFLATSGGFERVVRMLVERGAEVNVKRLDGYAPLHIAVDLAGADKVLRVLLEKGADVDVKDGNGKTALHLAVMCGHVELVRVLLEKGADPDVKSREHGHTALHNAVLRRNEPIVRLMLKHKVSADIPRSQKYGGFTARQLAVLKGNGHYFRPL